MRKGCLIAVGVLLVLVITALGGFHYYVNHRVKDMLTEEEYATFQKLYTEPVNIPEAYLKETTYSDELKQQAIKVSNLFQQRQVTQIQMQELQRLNEKFSLSEEQWKQVEQKLQNIKPYIEALTTLVQLKFFAGAKDKMSFLLPLK